jgi:uncharacterized protein (DUF433 family)
MSLKTPAATGRTEAVIVRDPNILSGRPVFRGTRVPVDVLFEKPRRRLDSR